MSYNAKQHLLKSIQSVLDSSYSNLTVLVVDNNSTDGSADAVTSKFPQVRVIRSTKNLGFGGGNNLGIESAITMGVDYILFLNDDHFVENDTVSRLLQFMESSPYASIATSIVIQDKSKMVLWAGGNFNSLFVYTRNLGWKRPLSSFKESQPYRTGFSDFGGVMVRSSVLKESGYFDESYFLYINGVELSLRIKRAGGTIWVVPSAIVSHVGQASIDPEKGHALRLPPTAHYHHSREAVIFIRKEYSSIGVLLRIVARIAFTMPYYLLFYSKKGEMTETAIMMVKGTIDGIKFSVTESQKKVSNSFYEPIRTVIVGTGLRDIPQKGYGGIERYIAELAKALRNVGVDIEILNKLMPDSTDMLKHLRFSIYVIMHIRQMENRIIHLNTPIPAIFLGLLGYRYIYTSHSRYWFGNPPFFKRILHFSDILAVYLSSVSIALSPELLEKFRLLVRKGTSVLYIPPGAVEIGHWKPSSAYKRENLVVGFGAVISAKRYDILAKATRGLQAEVVIIGPILDNALKYKLLGINPMIKFLGEVSDEEIDNILSKAKVIVHEADYELSPTSVVRAMSNGVPVIGSPAISHIVKNGKTGFIIPSSKEDLDGKFDIRAHINLLLTNDELFREMSSNCIDEIKLNYSLENTAKLYKEVYISFMRASQQTAKKSIWRSR